MQTIGKATSDQSVYVFMEETKFARTFALFPATQWRFLCCRPNDHHDLKTMLSAGSHVLIDSESPALHEVESGDKPLSAVILMSHNDVGDMIDLLNKHKCLNHIHCLSGANFYDQLVGTLVRLTQGGQHRADRKPPFKNYKSESLDHYGQKVGILAGIRTFAGHLDSFKGLPNTAVTVASELIMNAVFDAPIDPESKLPKYAHLERNQDLVLLSTERIEVAYGSDDRHLVLSVTDRFGSLTREKIVSNLYRCAQQSDDQVRLCSGGAGVGLYMLLNMCSQIDFYIDPGRSTEVVTHICASKRQRDYEMQGSAINIYVNGVKS